ncbi:MAG TPA: VWA domain-containing protein [Bryobacteraceae bacterium]|jgi:VWFA-related protein|nr:VWA domain-containing protein [Bryobacteraceae bacterium]
MRRRNNFLNNLTIAGAALLFAPLFIFGQQNKPPVPSDPDDTVFSSDTRLVPLNVTVMDKSGRLVTNLPQSAFQVYENGVQQQIKLFKREDVPVSLGLIIDNSGSMREKRQAVESAALALVKDSNRQDEVFIINFNDEVYLDTDFTNDIQKMEQGLTKIDSRGGTAMRDAIRLSAEHLKDKAKRDKKVVLVVTDGNDNASVISLDSLTKLAQQDDVLIYAIGLLTDEDKREAKKAQRALQLLAESTGGTVFYPKELSEVDRIAHEVARDIRNQYTIGYTPSNAALDGTYRQIKLVVKAPGNPIARTRSGYYATKEQPKTPRESSSK